MSLFIDLTVAFFLVTGTVFIMLAAIGILRMPDLYLRMSATTKAATLGVGCMLAAVAIHFWDTSITARTSATIIFLVLTAPVGAHVVARAAYFIGIPIWIHSLKDELKGKYNKDSHTLSSEEQTEKKEAEKELPGNR